MKLKIILVAFCSFPFSVIADVLFLQNQSLPQILDTYENLTQKTIVRSVNLPNDITLSFDSHGEMRQEDIIRGLETMLAINGVALVQVVPRILKAVPLSESERSPEEKRELRVFTISHGKAQDIVLVLNSVLQRGSSGSNQNSFIQQGTPSGFNTNQPGVSTQGQPRPVQAVSASGINASVVADIRTNSIIAYAVPAELQQIQTVLEQLDVVLEQVKIDVMIFEVVKNEDEASGLSSLGFTVSEDGYLSFQGKGVTTSNISGYDFTATLKPFSFSALLSLAESSSNVELLGHPSVTVAHNQSAKLVVSEQRPILTGVTSDGTNLNSRSSSITYKDIGITLNVLPLIGNGQIQLSVQASIGRVTGVTMIDGNAQPTIGNRSVNSFVTLKDGETLLLCGLVQNEMIESSGTLSFLRLKSRTKEVLSRELIIFIRPSILTPSSNNESEDLPLFSPDFEGYTDDFIGPPAPGAPQPGAGTDAGAPAAGLGLGCEQYSGTGKYSGFALYSNNARVCAHASLYLVL